jgi:hypothetical protein
MPVLLTLPPPQLALAEGPACLAHTLALFITQTATLLFYFSSLPPKVYTAARLEVPNSSSFWKALAKSL